MTQGSVVPEQSPRTTEELVIDPELKQRLNGGPGHAELRQLIDHKTFVEIVGEPMMIGNREVVRVRPCGNPDGPAVQVRREFVISAKSAALRRRMMNAAARPPIQPIRSDHK
ncbi:MAG: hypothetical protein HY474_00310 [Candidatus Sungbacteria bacterium]|uniref:Uncharacterized protein n=1 Tax=Candidatus Sungiibacteriota bacterium TaxID=2750080 RepID=A0A933DSN8_9BACT|nr:hypothetical protein [Candidatus Sungbacteria bacterium]